MKYPRYAIVPSQQQTRDKNREYYGVPERLIRYIKTFYRPYIDPILIVTVKNGLQIKIKMKLIYT